LSIQFLVTLSFPPSKVKLTSVLNSVNAHAEDLRSSFVAHEGKKELKVTVDGGDRYTVDFGYMAELMTTQIHENVRIPSLN